MEVRHLELLRDLRERGALGAVATATYRTPWALSQQLRTAERELGVALVEPASRGLRLTWAGEILAEGADDVLAALARVQAAVDAGRGEPSGTVRIGTLPSAGAALLPRFSTPPSDLYRLIPLTGVRAVRSIVAIGRPERVERRAVGAVIDLLAEIGGELSAAG